MERPTKATTQIDSLVSGFLRSAGGFPERPALFVNEKTFTYRQLADYANAIASTIIASEDTHSLAAIFTSRSLTAYAGILGILLAGKGYVPLNPRFPVVRSAQMLKASGCRSLVVGQECAGQLPALLALINVPLFVILPDTPPSPELAAIRSQHCFIYQTELARPDENPPIAIKIDPESPAYLLFTSGSTGMPKGIVVSQENVTSYIRFISQQYEINEHDRFSQMFDLTFDLSVHDLFVCFEKGACLYSVPQTSLLGPAKFVRDHELTHWFSVPSVGMFMSRMHMLKPNSFPSLRVSLFCGEPLPALLAEEWQAAAPNSVVENLYGPTEASIAISRYRWQRPASWQECRNGIVPIGGVFNDQRYCLLDENHVVVEKEGELCLSGAQVTKSYLNDDAKTAQQFIHIPALDGALWYRTGDLVEQDDTGCLHYLRRIDEQVQILGHRVELPEVEEVIRIISKEPQVSCLAWPIQNGIASGIVGFIFGGRLNDEKAVIRSCQEHLPDYMVPSRIFSLEKVPLNANGKVDRQQLREWVEHFSDRQKGKANGGD